ncbi:succinylglutamate desuccinylase, partial [Paraburkholderia sp. BR14262]
IFARCTRMPLHGAKIGDMIRENDPLFDIVDPMTGATTTVNSTAEGVFYMRRAIRFVTAGAPLGRVTGTRPIRSGVLLGA